MINWQSILSSFDDKPTLLEWLKKVQKALNESALTTVTVSQEKTGRVNSITLTFNFQDGTKIVAPAFTVQDGKDGVDGIGMTDLVNTDLTNNNLVVTYDTTDGLRVFATQSMSYSGGYHNSGLEFRLPIMAGNGINIVKKANAEKVEIKADLYQHVIKITGRDMPYSECFAYLTVISSKNLNVEFFSDLITLLGDTFEYPATGYDIYNLAYVYKVTQDGIIGIGNDGTSKSLSFVNMTVFTDTVTTV